MKLILRKDVDKLGKMGEIVNVKDGYARNYLIPKEFAFLASPAAIRRTELVAKSQSNLIDKQKAEAMALVAKMAGLQVPIHMKVAEADKLYASVNAQLISNKLAELGYNLDKQNILLEEPIKTLGEFDVPIKIYADINTTVKVVVLAEEENKE